MEVPNSTQLITNNKIKEPKYDVQVNDLVLVNWIKDEEFQFNLDYLVCRGIQIGQELDGINELKLDEITAEDAAQWHHAGKIVKETDDTFVIGQELTTGYVFSEYPKTTVYEWIDKGNFCIRRPIVEEIGVYQFAQGLIGKPYGWFNIGRIMFDIIFKTLKLKYFLGDFVKALPIINLIIVPMFSAKGIICSQAEARTDYFCSNRRINVAAEFGLNDNGLVTPMHLRLSNFYKDITHKPISLENNQSTYLRRILPIASEQ